MTLDRRRFLAVSAAAAALPSVAGAQSGWTRRAPMPWVAQEIYCAAMDGQVVVAGGLVRNAIGQTHINDRTALYDVAADRWSEGPRLPQPRHHPMLVATDRWVFAFGGYDRREGGEWTSMTDVWALGDEGWQVVGQMPGPLAETVGLHLDNRVHLVTGRSPAGGGQRRLERPGATWTRTWSIWPARTAGRRRDRRPWPGTVRRALSRAAPSMWRAGGR